MDRMYVPNPQNWVKYYENILKGNHNPYINQNGGGKRKQVGGSLIGSPGTFMIPIENVDHLENQNSSDPLTVKLVSPAQQTVEQAKTELQVLKKAIKPKASPKPISSTKKRRTVKTSRALQKRKSGSKKEKKTFTHRKIKKSTKKIRKIKKSTKKIRKIKKAKGKKFTTKKFKDIFENNYSST
ncbi:unnamed protein product [Mytilus coruscus]|uniref:Uncharacterized protein n=1 Tax=Mytilus coruscus TaxID=42192 RepID=A0A6J8CKQ9_MYTCO|nr:unnamed protein product [Mytilus coruscus]